MRHLKALGLALLAAAALTAFAATASAASLTSPIGTYYKGEVKASNSGSIQTDEPIVRLGFVNTVCEGSSFKGVTESPGVGTARITLTEFALKECNGGAPTISVSKPGVLEIHTDTGSNGLVTWSGAEITFLTHRTFFGVPYTEHCIYYTEDTPFGTLTAGTSATLDIGSFKFLNKATDEVCTEPVWTGSYTIETPHTLYVD